MKKQLLFVVSIVLTATFYAQNIPSYVPTNGLVGWWPFNGNANDESGNGNHGTVNGATLTSDRNGIANKAYDFNGINQFISINNSISIQYIKTISVSIWLRTRNYYNWGGNSYFPIMCKTNNSSYFGYYNVEFNPSGPNSFINMRGSYDAKYIKRLETWYHLVVVNDQSNVKYYINGKLIGTYNCVNQAGGIGLASDLPLEIGRDVAGAPKYTNGQLDDIAIYNRALTEQEITALYLSETCTKPQAAITPKSTTNIKEKESVILAATQGNGYSYAWYKDGVAIANATDSNYTAILPGVYTVKVTSASCDSTSAGVTIKRAYALPNYLPTNGLVGWWPFNGNANDESGNGNHGTVNGATLATDRNGKRNNSFSFDGISNYISIYDKENLRLLNTDFTLNTWILLDDLKSNINHIFYKGQSSGDVSKFLFAINNNKIGFHTNPPASLNYWKMSNPILQSQNWLMVTVLKNNDKLVFYINGMKDVESLLNYSIPNTDGIPIRIGGAEPNGSGWMKGKLDDISIYNRALTQEEITDLYLGEACTTPIATITPKSTTNIKEKESVVLAATQGNGYSYAWYKDGVAIANATDSNYTAILPGLYTVKVTSASCDSTSAGVTVKRAYTLPNYLPTNGLTGWWPFNGNANDESGNGNHGTVNGATLTTDRNGVANSTYNFKGINDYIEMKQSNSPIQIMNGITVSFWFKTNNSNTNDNRKFIISKYKNGHGIQIELTPNGTNLTNGSLRMGLRDASSIEPESNVYTKDRYDNNLWHFGVLTFNNTKLTQYIDNIKKGEFYTNNKNFDNDQVLIFGALKNDYYLWQNGTAFFDGCIDDIAIYNRALTQEEITALYLGEACTTPIATITPQSATSFCSGGSVNINAATNANYTYQWLNNGAAISAAKTATYKATTSGKYSVIVKNNSGCIDTSSVVTVTVTPTPSLPILTGPATLCYNSKAIFKASIAGGTWGVANDYLLISSPQGLFRNNKMPPSNLYKTGVTYTLKSKDQLCSVTAQKSVWIRNVAATSITLTAPKQTLKVGEEVAATATTKITGNALFWMSASTSFVSVTGVSPYIALVKGLRPATGANITFSADDAAKGCRNAAFLPFTVTAAASMVENETNTSIYTTDLNVYPNPSNGIVTIENIGDAKTISLIDVTGRVLKTTPVNADRMRLDYSNITKGNYFISFQGETLKEMKSIVIE